MKVLSVSRRKGMVLIIVVVAIMLMAVVVAGILSRNVSSAFVDEKGRQRFQAELLTKGAFWIAYQSMQATGTLPTPFFETVDGTTYKITYSLGAPGPSATQEILTQVTY